MWSAEGGPRPHSSASARDGWGGAPHPTRTGSSGDPLQSRLILASSPERATTVTELSDIATARDQRAVLPKEPEGGQRDAQGVVGGTPAAEEVLADRRLRGAAKQRGARGTARTVAGGDHDVRRGLGHVGPRAERDPDVRRGQGGGVVQAVADHRDPTPRLQLVDPRGLPVGEDARDDPIGREPERRADGRGRRRVVSREEDDVPAGAAELIQADDLAGVGLDRVGQADHPGRSPVGRDEQDGPRLRLPRAGGFRERPDVDPCVRHVPGRTDDDLTPVDRRRDARAAGRAEVGHGRAVAVRGEGTGDRMFAPGFGTGGEAEQSRLVEAGGRGDGDDRRTPLGERARLVEDDRREPVHPLEGRRLADEEPGAGPPARGDGHGHRRRQAEGARAGDDEDGRRIDDAVFPVVPGSVPSRGRSPRRDEQDDLDEPNEIASAEPLDPGLGRLGVTDHADDPLESAIATEALGFDQERAVTVAGRPRDAVAGPLRRRDGLAGEHALVDLGVPLDHPPIDRHRLAGTDADMVSLDDFSEAGRRPRPHRGRRGRPWGAGPVVRSMAAEGTSPFDRASRNLPRVMSVRMIPASMNEWASCAWPPRSRARL